MTRISESQLILPSLFLMSLSLESGLSTSDLIPKLRELLKPSGEDLEILSGRNDDKFSQKVRNLKAHNTFEKYGFAKYEGGVGTITLKGEKYLQNNMDKLRYLLVNDFHWDDLKEGLTTVQKSIDEDKSIEIFDETVMIQEGVKKLVEAKIYERSEKLRKAALEHYSHGGEIFCIACNFNYRRFYGSEIGKSYIEIHHLKPIFKFEGEDLQQTIQKAMKNVTPVCSNCHRMIHRDWKNPLKIDFLKRKIAENGVFAGSRTN